MKTNRLLLRTAALFLLLLHVPRSTCFAQGSLTPPAAPAPTMKSLDQIEARTAITNSGAVTISQPGSYYLTRNITVSSGDAISINTNGVTLDLNGLTVSSTEASPAGAGILLASGLGDITILNGHIRGGVIFSNNVYSGSGFANGIYYSGTPPYNARVSHVSVSGCQAFGIYLGAISTAAESCSVKTVGNFGIVADDVSSCTAVECGSGIGSVNAINSYGAATGSGAGVNSSSAVNCYGSSADGDGIDGSVATSCYGLSTNGIGLFVNLATTCSGKSVSGVGLNATLAHNCSGFSSSNTGINSSIADGCYGQSSGTFPGITAFIANICRGASGGTAIIATHNINSF